MLTSIIYRWDDVLRMRSGYMPHPHFVTLQTCYACNQHCVGCAYAGKLGGKVMSFDDHVTVINKLLDEGVVAFEFCGGGEPTLIPRLDELIAYIASNGGLAIGLMTNGTHMPDQLVDALVKHGTYVRVSLEAATPEAYAKYKRVPEEQWFRVLDNIKRLQSVRDAAGSQLEVSVKFAVSQSLHGAGHYIALRKLIQQLRPDRCTIKPIRHGDEELRDREYESCLAHQLLPPVVDCGTIAQDLPVPQCWLSPLHTVIDCDGNMHICCYYYHHGDSHRLGNLLMQSFNDIWLSKEHQEKIAAIDRTKCAEVDCKFFRHHMVAEQHADNGRLYLL